MFFIFGWGRRAVTEYGPTIPTTCPNCNNQKWFHLVSYKTWFTLFFVPVIPYESKTLLQCPVCSRAVELDDKKARRAMRLRDLAAAYLGNRMSQSEYLAELRDVRLLGQQCLLPSQSPSTG